MPLIDIIGSGSKGNAFLITIGDSRVLLDAGVSFPKIQKALGFSLKNLDGCFVTHEHKDHSQSVQKLMDAGVDCYMTKGTAEALGLKGHRLITHRQKGFIFETKNYQAFSFKTTHDATEPCGYVFQDKHGNSLAYITDTGVLPEPMPGITHLIIECNYCESLLWESDLLHAQRVKSTHLGLKQVKAWLRQCTRLRELVVMHLSEHHADDIEIDSELYCVTPIDAGLRIA